MRTVRKFLESKKKKELPYDPARGFLSGSAVNNLPAMQEMNEMFIGFLGWGDPLEECMTTHSSILAWRIPWTEETCRLQSMGSQESDMT